MHHLDARAVAREQVRDADRRVRGPTGVDLGGDVAHVRVVHQDFPRGLDGAVDVVLRVELARVVVDVDLADAGLDRALAQAVERRRGGERLGVGALTRSSGAARADELLAQGLGGGDLGVERGLGDAAVATDDAQAVLVGERAELGRGHAVQAVRLDDADALGLQHREDLTDLRLLLGGACR